MNRIHGSVLGLLAATFAASGVASAEEAALTLERSGLRGRSQIAAAPSYVFELERGDFNPFGVGLGAQGGYTLGSGLYLGARFVYQLGDSIASPTSRGDAQIEVNILLLGGEVGYDIDAGAIIVRPSLQLGIAHVMAGATTRDEIFEDSADELFLAPGASVILPFPDGRVFIGADGRCYAVLDGTGLNGFGLGGFVGAAF